MKKLVLLIIVILTLSKEKQCFAQNFANKDYYLVDSLDLDAIGESDQKLIKSSLELFHKATNDTSKVNVLNDICENMMHEDWEKYQRFQLILIEDAITSLPPPQESLMLRKALASALGNIGMIHNNQGDIALGLEYYHKSLKIFEELKDKQGMAYSYNNIGYIYQHQGDIALGLEYYHKALKIQEEINDKKGMAESYNNIGYIHQHQGDLALGLEYYHKALKIREEIKDKKGMASSYNNIGMIHKGQGDLALALEYYHKSLKIQEEIGYKQRMADSYNNIGIIHNNQGDLALALDYFHKSLKIREEIKDKDGMANSYHNIAFIALNQGEVGGPEGALALSLKSLTLSQELGFPLRIKLASSLLSKIYSKQGKYQKALEMRNLEIQMRDSLASEAAIKATANQQAKYEYEKQKALDDKDHEKQIALEEGEIEKQRVISWAIGVGLVLVVVFLLFVFNRLQVTRKQKLIIEETNEELNQTNEELAAQRDAIEKQKEVVEEAHNEIRASINYAKRIQNAILPSPSVINELIPNNLILYKPKDVVAGDFYWLEQVGNTTLLAAADCTGHGVPGAMVSVVCHNAMNRAVREFGLTEPGLILDKTREIVVEEFEKSEDDVKDGMDIALCSLSGNKLQYAGAHNPLWIVRDDEILETKADQSAGSDQHNYEIIEIKADKQPIGKFDNPAPYKTHTIELQKEDSIYIFSDGFPDQFGGVNDKKFGSKRLKDLLISFQDKSMENQKEVLESTLQNWMRESGSEQLDDICIMGVKI